MAISVNAILMGIKSLVFWVGHAHHFVADDMLTDELMINVWKPRGCGRGSQ